ncbi:hypothetical protein GCM10010193_56980 [Kitasatospora atroaurantiaca]|uniref:Uncharacterized protein n=1 Tax=Kitasatospora atroaurantiaca TaxID=285545 RepID=A0A561EMU7_9ACTN|nr:hypothetical protein [Kitasatospora atroaurantiaca]TWE16946.1 hypothetical protein FB465_1941 [Kitasatospora atroaurantiaca]
MTNSTPSWALDLIRPTPTPAANPRLVRRRLGTKTPASPAAATPLARHMQAAQQALAGAISRERGAAEPGPASQGCPCAFPHPDTREARNDLAAAISEAQCLGKSGLHRQLLLLARADGCPSLR